MITEEVVHVKGIPKKLVVFLHGYIDSAVFLDKKLDVLYEHLDDFAVHLPQSPLICEIHENNRQWYSMHRFDPNDDRKFVATMEECAAFYNRMTLGVQEAAHHLVPYIEQALDEYGLKPEDLYLCGFSQGAMAAIYIALMFPQKIGGLISFSGILTAGSYLMKHAVSFPDTLLIHGNCDNLVRPEAMDYSTKYLQQLGCRVETYVVDGANHVITPQGLKQAAAFVRRHSQPQTREKE